MKNMLLVSAQWSNEIPTFKLVPLTQDCPFIEMIYAPEHKSLAMINKEKKGQFKFIPQIDQNGDVMRTKNGVRQSGTNVKEERKLVEVNYEHYIINEKEQEEVIRMFAINADSFDFLSHLKGEHLPVAKTPSPVSTSEIGPESKENVEKSAEVEAAQ